MTDTPVQERSPDVVDDFSGPDLRRDLWIDHYLPHWTTPERSAARWRLVEDGLQLRIEQDQPDWRPEDGPMRVSNLQTGVHSGPLGSREGTHRHRSDGLVVRRDTGTRRLWTPPSGRVEVTVSATRDPDCMLAVWLVGLEDGGPEQSGEICLCEIDADAIHEGGTVVRSGLKAHHDPALTTDMAEVTLPFAATRTHTWSAEWGAGGTEIACEGAVLRRLDQAPAYPMVLMLDLFELGRRRGPYPKAATIHRFRGWSG